MIEQQGRVVAVTGHLAEVRLGGSSGCVRCDAGEGCGAGVFGRLLKRKPVIVSLVNTVSAKPGQAVMVGIPDTLFLKMTARFYLAPLVAGVVGAAVGHYLSILGGVSPAGTDAITLLCGLASGAVVLVWNRADGREFSESVIVQLLRLVEIQETRM